MYDNVMIQKFAVQQMIVVDYNLFDSSMPNLEAALDKVSKWLNVNVMAPEKHAIALVLILISINDCTSYTARSIPA